MKENLVEIYTDGGCDVHSGGAGAWAFVVVINDDITHEVWGGLPTTTNGKMEVVALKMALQYAVMLDKTTEVIIRSDSQYCVKSYNEWAKNWKNNKWRKSNNKPIEHQNEWQIIDQLRSENIKVEWVKAHNGNKWNEYVDGLTHNR